MSTSSSISSARYTHGSIGSTMLKTALSMIPATLAISGYNIADTYFVAQLGKLPLAAMGFTFPVVMLIACVYRGIAIGAMTPLSHSLGGNKTPKAAKIASSGLLLIILCALLIGLCGVLSINLTFNLFGADNQVMPMIVSYMNVWYIGNVTIALSMACNDFLIASGATRSASSMMFAGMLMNVILDPIFIFGFGPVPAMGITGAAIATVVSQLTAGIILLVILHRRYHLLTTKIFEFRLLKSAWNLIIKIAIPAIIGTLMMPVGNGIVTRIVANFGNDTVAACAAAGRLEILAFIVPMSLGMALMPMIGQNFGARHYDRIDQCRSFAMRFAGTFELFMALIYFILSPYIAELFSKDHQVIEIMTLYLRIIPFGFGMMEIHRYCGFIYTGCNRAVAAAWLNALRLLGLLVPFSLLALWAGSVRLLFFARLSADILAGLIGLYLVTNMTRRLLEKNPKPSRHPIENEVPVDFNLP